MTFTEPESRSEYNFFFKRQLIQTFTESKDSNCFILEQKNIFNFSDLIFTGGKCHLLLIFSYLK